MTTHNVTLHIFSQELTAAIVWWTFVAGIVVVFLCEVMNSSPGPTVSRKPCCAIAGGCTCGPAPPPRWLKVGDAFRRVRLLPPPCCFSISHTGSNCPKKEGCCPRRKVFLSVLSVIGHGPCCMKLPPLSFCFTLLNTFCFFPPFFLFT